MERLDRTVGTERDVAAQAMRGSRDGQRRTKVGRNWHLVGDAFWTARSLVVGGSRS